MSVAASDIKLVKSQVVNDTTTNGGRLGTSLVASGVADSAFPSAGVAERTTGSQKYRKVFWHNRNASNEALYDLLVFLENYTPGDDEVVFFAANQTNTQANITGSEDLYGVAQLNANIVPGATSIAVVVHDWADMPIFRNGSLLRISDKATIDGAGNTEFVEVHAATAISAAGNVVTIPLAAAVTGSYTAAATRVASVMEGGTLQPTLDNWAETSSLGTFDEATHPVTLSNKGTIEQAVTLTFTSATAFTATSDVLGSLGTGVIGSNFAPTNSVAGAPYFTVPSAGWGGTWATGNTVVFHTHPAALPLWLLRDIPATTAAESGNKAVLAWEGGSN